MQVRYLWVYTLGSLARCLHPVNQLLLTVCQVPGVCIDTRNNARKKRDKGEMAV